MLIVSPSGAGIGGLLIALALTRLSKERKDVKIDIFEAKEKVSENGAGITFCMHPMKIFESLNLVGDFLKITKISRKIDFKLGMHNVCGRLIRTVIYTCTRRANVLAQV